MKRIGWKYESHRHSLAAKGIKTNFNAKKKYMSQQQVKFATLPGGNGQNLLFFPPAPSKGTSRSRDETIDLRAVSPEKRIEYLNGESKVLQAAEDRLRADSPAAQALRDFELSNPTDIVAELNRRKKAGIRSPAEDGALRALLERKVIERAEAGIAPSFSERMYLSLGARQAMESALRRKSTDEYRERLDTSATARALEKVKQDSIAEVFGNVGDSEAALAEREATLLSAERKRDKVEAELASRVGPGFLNPVIPGFQDVDIHDREVKEGLHAGEAGLKGAFNPFTDKKGHNDLKELQELGDQPLLTKYDQLIGKPLVGNKMTKQTVKKEVDELYGAKDDLARADTTPYRKGKRAFEKGDREGVVKAIVDLEAEGQKLNDREALVQQTEAQVLSDRNRQDLLRRGPADEGIASFSLSSMFDGAGAKQLAEETSKIGEVRGNIRKSRNEVLGRAEDLKNSLRRMDAKLPPATSTPGGMIKVFRDRDESNSPVPNFVEFSEDFAQR